MSFSEFGQYVQASWSTVIAQDRPMDAGHARALVSNIQHIYDESGQTLINMTTRSGLNINLAVTTGAYQPLLVFGPFPIRLRPTSGAYRLRMRGVFGRTGAVAVETRVVVAPSYGAALALAGAPSGAPSIWDASVNTTQSVFVPPSDDMIWISDASVSQTYAPISAMDSANNAVSTTWPQCFVALFGRSTSGSQNLRIFSLYACEYMGL